MVNTKELRLGNLLRLPKGTFGGREFTVEGITKDFVTGGGEDYIGALQHHKENVFSIPLTEERLKSFGFSVAMDVFFSKDGKHLEKIDGGWLFTLDGEYEVFIQHTHQLQNLFYDLTGTELELKEEV